jgi:hypothetical protein
MDETHKLLLIITRLCIFLSIHGILPQNASHIGPKCTSSVHRTLIHHSPTGPTSIPSYTSNANSSASRSNSKLRLSGGFFSDRLVVVGFPVGNLVFGFADVGFALIGFAVVGIKVGLLVLGLAVTGFTVVGFDVVGIADGFTVVGFTVVG